MESNGMAIERFVFYAGQKYWIQTTGRYYSSSRKDDEERLLHRRVWFDAHGPIDSGIHIHHIDEDWTNNSLENLEAINASDHRRMHMEKRLKDPEYKATLLRWLEMGRDKAAEWHRSAEGRLWHIDHG
ncbi:MAG TPA: HNH endonuclease, partial [Rhodospirillales bacterium]|nr:HNH endonuclease [Rhodospirillales bacterium]